MCIFCEILLYRSAGWCKDLNRIRKSIVKNIFLVFFFRNIRCSFKEARHLKIYQIYKLNVAGYMYNTLSQGKSPMLRPFLGISYPSHNYLTENINETLLPFLRVEAIRLIFKYQLSKFDLKCRNSSSAKNRTSYLRMLYQKSI